MSSADPGARLLSGLSRSITPEEYEACVRDQTITEALATYEIAPGDVFFLPAGRIHAIGAGSFLAEIQQTSDLTYRIYDYGRLGLDGKPRELHIKEAKEAIDYRVYPSYKEEYSGQKRRDPTGGLPVFHDYPVRPGPSVPQRSLGLDSFFVVMCVDGGGTLIDSEASGKKHSLPIRQGETVLIPATSESVALLPDGAMTCLGSYIP